MSFPDQFNCEGYLDLTAFCAIQNVMRQRDPRDHNDWVYRRGDVYLANLEAGVGSEQSGVRPVVVLQNDTGNRHSPTLITAPITSHAEKRRDLPVHYFAGRVRGLKGPAVVLLEQVRTIDKKRICRYLGRMTRHQMEVIDEKLKISLNLDTEEKL